MGRKEPEGRQKSPGKKRTQGSGKEGKHRWNSCGSEAGKDERKRTESQVPEAGTEAWETRRKRRWKAGEPKGRTEALRRPLMRRKQEEGNGRTAGSVAGTVREADERKWKETGKRPKAKAQGKHSWNSCGSEARKGERKQTGSRVREPGENA